MPDSPNKLSQFWQELKRRRVIHVIVVYATTAFVILEAVDIVFPRLGFPDRVVNFVMILLAAGFPVVLIFSWIFDVTPKGIEKTKPLMEVQKEEVTTVSSSWKIATYVCIVIIGGLVTFNIISNIRKPKDFFNQKKSIAVLPFYYYNLNPEAEDIGDAFANEIITQLYKIKGFDRIISHTSTLQYKGANKPSIPIIGRELDAKYVVEGHLERQADRVSIHIQVIESESDSLIWAEEYKGEWSDVFIIRATIAKQLASELQLLLTPEEIDLIEQKTTDNLKAYDLYLLGNQYRYIKTEEALFKSIELFESAIHLDPEFALAFTSMSDSYADLVWYAGWLPEEAYEKAREAAKRALEIDPDLAEPHTSLARVKINYDWDIAGAEEEFKKAINLNPHSAPAYYRYAALLLLTERKQEANKYAKKSVELNPNWNMAHVVYAVSIYRISQPDSAINYLKKRIDIDSTFVNYYSYLGQFYVGIGEYDMAISELEKAMSIGVDSPISRYYRGIAYARKGMTEQIRKELKALDDLEKQEKVVSFGRAILYAELGNLDTALVWLEKAYNEHHIYLLWLRTDTLLCSSIRSDPRYIDIYNKIWKHH